MSLVSLRNAATGRHYANNLVRGAPTLLARLSRHVFEMDVPSLLGRYMACSVAQVVAARVLAQFQASHSSHASPKQFQPQHARSKRLGTTSIDDGSVLPSGNKLHKTTPKI